MTYNEYQTIQMRQQTILIFMILIVACRQQTKIDTSNTELDKLVLTADSTRLIEPNFYNDLLVILNQHNFSSIDDNPYEGFANNGLVKYQTFIYSDTTKKHLKFSLAFYDSNKYSLTAFLKFINFWACCIPDEDIMKLKNFNNLTSFKNSYSVIYCIDKLVILQFSSSDTITSAINAVKGNDNFYKLEIGNGGPAKWTIK